MSASSSNVSVWVGQGLAWVRVSGRVHTHSGELLKSELLRARKLQLRTFLLDLSECQMMDSTFVGVMTSQRLRLAPGETMELLRPSQRVRDVLDNMGVLELFKIVDTPPVDLRNLDLLPALATEITARAICRSSLEAHQALMEANPANIPKFKDVTELLAEDLKRRSKNP